ncbi:hypothetical protein [Aeromicrobium sp. A1-2]|uniref:hypothetical protein n=1 Tax=Aeromicrobium sp. A1-2 TaxID=2107713 RepID=UPI00352C993B
MSRYAASHLVRPPSDCSTRPSRCWHSSQVPPPSSASYWDVELKPLSARSVLLSLILGAHPEPVSPANLVRAGEFLDVSPSTVRAALTRAVASGELQREGRDYGWVPN